MIDGFRVQYCFIDRKKISRGRRKREISNKFYSIYPHPHSSQIGALLSATAFCNQYE